MRDFEPLPGKSFTPQKVCSFMMFQHILHASVLVPGSRWFPKSATQFGKFAYTTVSSFCWSQADVDSSHPLSYDQQMKLRILQVDEQSGCLDVQVLGLSGEFMSLTHFDGLWQYSRLRFHAICNIVHIRLHSQRVCEVKPSIMSTSRL